MSTEPIPNKDIAELRFPSWSEKGYALPCQYCGTQLNYLSKICYKCNKENPFKPR